MLATRKSQSKWEIRKDFPLLIWASFLAAGLVIALLAMAFSWMSVQHQVDATKMRFDSIKQLTDGLADRASTTPQPRDSALKRLRELVGKDRRRLALIGLMDHAADTLERTRRLAELDAVTLQTTALERDRLTQKRDRLQATMVILTCLTLVVISFVTGVSLGELKHRYEAFRRQKELNELKSHFITVASHEFRTPLSSIQLSVSLIERYAANMETELILKQGRKIKGTIANLTAILEDFLSIEKLESGKIKADIRLFNLQELCQELVDEQREVVQPDQHLQYETQGGCNDVRMDQNLLRNAIINLLSNAIKYSGPTAHIKLETSVNEEQIVIRVSDNGTGIPVNRQKELFTPFYRADARPGIPGTGLGLSIVKKYAELMNGKVSFYSDPGKETVFAMNFPVNMKS